MASQDRFGSDLGPLLEAFGAHLGRLWGHLGAILSHLGAILGPLGGRLGSFRAFADHLEEVMMLMMTMIITI